MIKFKLVDGRTKVARQLKDLQEKLEELPKEFLRETVEEIVRLSPVDTGTYMDSHNVGVVGARESSHGKVPNQSYDIHADNAIIRMNDQIDALPEDSTKHFIANNSVHAWKVEYEGWKDKGPYSPYTIARAKSQQILDKVVKRVLGR